MSLFGRRIASVKDRIFRAHPRPVSVRWNGNWYDGIRVGAHSEGLDITSDGYDPDFSSLIKLNYLNFLGVDGKPDPTPQVNAVVRFDNTDWIVQRADIEGDDIKLICRKQMDRV